MGILGYPNMDDNNRDGIFGDYSEVYSNYSEGAESVVQEDVEQTVEAVENLETQQEQLQADEIFQEQQEGDGIPQVAPQASPQSNLVVYAFVLVLLVVSALGVYLYKKHTGADVAVNQEQAMGDYFYDQATANGDNQITTTVEVDLNADSNVNANEQTATNVNNSQPAENVKVDNAENVANVKQEVAKKEELTPLQKAEAKKKADAEKEKQLTFSGASVTVPVLAGGRLDPFVPINQIQKASDVPKFELIAPPTTIPDVDPMLDELMQTKISGIMFDSSRPSAIVNFGGTDQLVHKGDIVKGYKILNITKDTVVMSYKSNVYQATVGQSLNDGININPVSNLSNSFGGVYSPSNGNVIEINN